MSRPAPWAKAVIAQAGVEARLTARRGENLLAMIGVPIALLLFAGPWLAGRGDIHLVLPGTLAIAIAASGLVNLAIATAYERGYGVLKRLGGSPLGRSGLVAAKVGVVLIIAVAQVIGLTAVAALTLGWRPGPDASVLALAVTTVLGSAAFAGLGLLLAGTLRPEAALVGANVLFLAALGFAGALVPIAELPGPLQLVARVLPVGALSEAYAAALGSGADVLGRSGGGAPWSILGPWGILAPWGILGLWALVSTAAAARTFRWD
ncbi:MAG: ABC transporter permease [Chloroflexi bacterium]|nr:ABC transporter permease [Chloroflexota bacterium]